MAVTKETSQPARYTAGDIIQLRSGGPLLCVTYCQATSVNVIYHNSVSGLYETFTTHVDCVRHANNAPSVPQDARGLRNTTVTSSLS